MAKTKGVKKRNGNWGSFEYSNWADEETKILFDKKKYEINSAQVLLTS